MDALHPRMDHVEEHLYRDLDEMGRLHSLMGAKDPQSKIASGDDTTKNIKGKIGFYNFSNTDLWAVCLRNFNVRFPTGFLY